jgi:hypothetical protein
MTIKREFIVNRQGRDFVLYGGLLDAAHEKGLRGIRTTIVQAPTDLNGHIAIVHAVVLGADGQEFHGIGDADQGNVSRMMLPHLLRMCETRAKARALRDFVNVGAALADDPTGDDPSEPDGGDVATTHGRRPEPAPKPRFEDQEFSRQPEAQSGAPPEDSPPPEAFENEHPAVRQATTVARAAGGWSGGTQAPATPKQLQTIANMTRRSGKKVTTDGLSRQKASEIIAELIAEADQQNAGARS